MRIRRLMVRRHRRVNSVASDLIELLIGPKDQQLIAVVEIGDVTYLWLIRPDPVRDERGD